LSESLKVNTTLTQLKLSGKPENGVIVMYKLHCIESSYRERCER